MFLSSKEMHIVNLSKNICWILISVLSFSIEQDRHIHIMTVSYFFLVLYVLISFDVNTLSNHHSTLKPYVSLVFYFAPVNDTNEMDRKKCKMKPLLFLFLSRSLSLFLALSISRFVLYRSHHTHMGSTFSLVFSFVLSRRRPSLNRRRCTLKPYVSLRLFKRHMIISLFVIDMQIIYMSIVNAWYFLSSTKVDSVL